MAGYDGILRVRHRRCLAFPLHPPAKTLPLPCVSTASSGEDTAFALCVPLHSPAKVVPLPCGCSQVDQHSPCVKAIADGGTNDQRAAPPTTLPQHTHTSITHSHTSNTHPHSTTCARPGRAVDSNSAVSIIACRRCCRADRQGRNCDLLVRHCLRPVFPLPFVAKTLPLPCGPQEAGRVQAGGAGRVGRRLPRPDQVWHAVAEEQDAGRPTLPHRIGPGDGRLCFCVWCVSVCGVQCLCLCLCLWTQLYSACACVSSSSMSKCV